MKSCAPLLVWLALVAAAPAATITTNDVTAVLGPDFFFDTASTGGNDNSATVFVRDISGYWPSNATVSLKGLGWASKAGGTVATSATVTFTDPAADGIYGTGDDVVGTRTDNLVSYTVAGSEYAWRFDSNVVFTAKSGALRISIAGFNADSPAIIYRKTTSGSTQDAVKLSLAGMAVGGTNAPAAISATASASGFWDQIIWNVTKGTVTGGLSATNLAVIGSERIVTFRGLPSNQTIAGLNLGDEAATLGRGTLIVSNGTLHVTGDAVAGRGAANNDGFLKIYGGTVQVDGSLVLGQSVESSDGWVEIGGGALQIGGDLKGGAFLSGGSLLRFRNPGAASVVQVGGKLDLQRTTLGLTFDTNYVHTPGATIPLIEYATREGQFINFRNGDELNASSNRFRIAYDVAGGGGRKQIALTALTNWPATGGPNVIFILADDQGFADLRMQGDAKYPMPELEKLAAAGARFTDSYVCGGVCHPSRSAILTGRYHQRFGADNNLGGPSYNGLSATERTVPQRLQGLGYRTYGIGKWHLGNTAEYLPNQRGFDRWYGINTGSRSYYNSSGEDNEFQNDMTLRPQDEGLYVADRIGNACVSFIDEQLTNSPGQPFFIYCAFTSVHAPMDINASDARFTRLQTEFGLTATNYLNSPIIHSGSSQATVDANRYELAAMTLALDENIGKIVNKVNTSGLSNHTVIIYLNDNGGAGWSASFGGNYSYNTPLRGYKGGGMTEGSIRVPAAIKWPGVIPAGQVITNPVNSLDLVATVVNATGNAVAAARNGLDGFDLLPLLRDGTLLPTNRVLCWRAGDAGSGGSAARMGNWKILADNNTGLFKLYNLRADVGESTDVSAANPAVLAELKERFAAWNSANIEPLYGSSDVIVDAALERSGIASGYRIRNRGTTPAYLTASLREPISVTANFSLGFYLRPTETNHASGEQLWFALGDSTTRATLIRAGIDFGAGHLRLIEGKTGGSSAVPLTILPTNFLAGTLHFNATTKQLTFAHGGTNVSLVLGGSYGNLSTYGCGAAAMEGEVMQPFQPARPTAAVQTFNLQPVGGQFNFTARFTGDSVFGPKLERATNVSGPYQADTQGLIVSLGGGLFDFSTRMTSGAANEFFRVTFNQP